jgi:crossover junction endodeoxyribonuclease RusA
MVVGLAPVTVEFPPPAPLLNMNDRLHWSVARKRARAWRTAALVYTRDQMGGARLGASMVTVELPVLGNRRRDPHNLFPTVKPIVDGLVDAGLWPDDTPEWVTTTEPALVSYRAAEIAVHGLVRVRITPRGDL